MAVNILFFCIVVASSVQTALSAVFLISSLVNLQASLKSSAPGDRIQLIGTIYVNQVVLISGPSTTITISGGELVFSPVGSLYVIAKSLEIIGVSIQANYTRDSPVITLASGNLTLNDVNVTNSHYTSANSIGGAIKVRSVNPSNPSHLVVKRSIFTGNSAYYGAAIGVTGKYASALICTSSFRKNTAIEASGGDLYFTSGAAGNVCVASTVVIVSKGASDVQPTCRYCSFT